MSCSPGGETCKQLPPLLTDDVSGLKLLSLLDSFATESYQSMKQALLMAVKWAYETRSQVFRLATLHPLPANFKGPNSLKSDLISLKLIL